ncbi:hypothetical protein ABZY81_43655 [Streptomyces sp. NPDC006514]|uniref:hypothetical protein n=1 Tax=Streptomyces sp. NPDC006514 TaxID=3154308 RepID=UPI0033BA4357
MLELTAEDGPPPPEPLPPGYREVLAVFEQAGDGLRTKDVCRPLGAGVKPRNTEGIRAKLKRLASRGILTERARTVHPAPADAARTNHRLNESRFGKGVCVNTLMTALVSALTSGVVAIVTLLLSGRQQRRVDERAEREQLNVRYLNPLRWHAAEVHYRLSLIVAAVDEAGSYPPALVVDEPHEIEGKQPDWFMGHGCALISSTYLTACLFTQLMRVRDDFPFLRLAKGDDTKLATLILRVHIAFLSDGGVYYVTQPSIGSDALLDPDGRLRSYREFCELLMDPARRVWVDILIRFHLEAARGDSRARADRVLTALRDLSDFLDKSLAGGASLHARWTAETSGDGARS